MRVDLSRALMVGNARGYAKFRRKGRLRSTLELEVPRLRLYGEGAYRRRGKRRATGAGEATLSLALSPPPPRVVSDNDRNGPS